MARNHDLRNLAVNVLALSGSPSSQSRSAWLLRWLLARIEPVAAAAELLSVRDLPAAALLAADTADAGIRAALDRVARARVVLIGTPIYKAAYSGVLKTFLDLLPQDGLRDKIVVRVATGGSPAHQLALDYALVPVLAALGARELTESLFVVDAQLPSDAGPGFAPSGEIRARLERIADALLAQVHAAPAPSRNAVSLRPRGVFVASARASGPRHLLPGQESL